MKKFLYIVPAALVCMLYAMLTILAGGVSGFQPIALLYICCPVLAAVFLRKGKWWGCVFGVAMGGVLLYNGMTAQPQVFAGFVAGIIFIGYYTVMGLVCGATKKKT